MNFITHLKLNCLCKKKKKGTTKVLSCILHTLGEALFITCSVATSGFHNFRHYLLSSFSRISEMIFLKLLQLHIYINLYTCVCVYKFRHQSKQQVCFHNIANIPESPRKCQVYFHSQFLPFGCPGSWLHSQIRSWLLLRVNQLLKMQRLRSQRTGKEELEERASLSRIQQAVTGGGGLLPTITGIPKQTTEHLGQAAEVQGWNCSKRDS